MLSTLSEEQAWEVWRFRAPLGMCNANTEFNRATKPPRGGMQFDMIIDPSEEKWQAKPSQGPAPSAPTALDIAVNQKLMLEELRETLEQIAALCPRHSLLDRDESDGHEGTASSPTPCRLQDFELATDASGEILHFSCRHSTTGVCAGYVHLHRKAKEVEAQIAG